MDIKWIINLSLSGTKGSKEDEINRRIAFSNVVFLSLPVVYLTFMIIDFRSFNQPIRSLEFDQFIVPIEIGVCFLCIWLNRKGYVHFSRILFLITWPFLLHLIPIKLLHAPLDYYIAFPFGMVFHALLIQVMISHRREPILFWAFLIPNFITTVFAGQILVHFVESGIEPNELVNDRYYRLDIILYWLLFSLVMYYILLVVERYIHKMNASNNLIQEQSEELKTLNQNLADEVKIRTHELEEQNEKLMGYAYYNAHLLRGPFCRIQGLIKLMTMMDDQKEISSEVLPRLDENIQELEHVISQIQLIVDSEKKIQN